MELQKWSIVRSMCVPEVVISGVEPGGGQVSVDGGESPASPGYHCQFASPPPPSTIHLSFCSEIARVVHCVHLRKGVTSWLYGSTRKIVDNHLRIQCIHSFALVLHISDCESNWCKKSHSVFGWVTHTQAERIYLLPHLDAFQHIWCLKSYVATISV